VLRGDRHDCSPLSTSTPPAGPSRYDTVGAADHEFAAFHREYTRRLRGLFVRLGARLDFVDDLTQDVLLRAFVGGIHKDADRDPWVWLATVAKHRLRDTRQKHSSWREVVVDDVSSVPAPAVESAEAAYMGARRSEGIAEALGGLSERHRRLITLHHLQGLAYDDIRAADDVSRDALKSTLARARATFRQRYEAIAERDGLVVVLGGLVARARRPVDRLREAFRSDAHAIAPWSSSLAGMADGVVVLALAAVLMVAGPRVASGSEGPVGGREPAATAAPAGILVAPWVLTPPASGRTASWTAEHAVARTAADRPAPRARGPVPGDGPLAASIDTELVRRDDRVDNRNRLRGEAGDGASRPEADSDRMIRCEGTTGSTACRVVEPIGPLTDPLVGEVP